jgi:two-component system CheB/CheR fusion protein
MAPRDVAVPEARAPSRDDPVQTRARPQRVLLVEDHADGAASLARILGRAGHDVMICRTGAEAVAGAAPWRPTVALVDLGLPDMSGWEVARRLRAIEDLANLRILALTGQGQASDHTVSLDAGMEAHLVKPVEPRRLLALLAQAPEPNERVST